jgi:hypothetical protein
LEYRIRVAVAPKAMRGGFGKKRAVHRRDPELAALESIEAERERSFVHGFFSCLIIE